MSFATILKVMRQFVDNRKAGGPAPDSGELREI
jgi:hypothetical protein